VEGHACNLWEAEVGESQPKANPSKIKKRSYMRNKPKAKGWEMAQVVQRLPSKHET
jgi:hypothetical protein